ncbi:beta-glucuronosyltransferase GlcAT14C-like isoform X1 [Carex rostrata]
MLESHSRSKHKRVAFFFLFTFPLLTLFLLPFAINPIQTSNPNPNPNPRPPRLAYLITGGDARRLRRLLRALYHPLNFYLIQLGADSSENERVDLEAFLRAEELVRKHGNVRVVERGCHASDDGPTEVACMLHAVVFLLRKFKGWSWFLNLDISDYPLMPQDDILHIFSYLPRELNFIDHTSKIGSKEHERVRPMIVDPALYISNKSGVVWVKEKRNLPSSFKIFVGSPRMVLSRTFLEYCIKGWDNLPRTLLLYYSNFIHSKESYFHTVICNSNQFQNTTINHDLRFMLDLKPPHQFFDEMADSGAPFVHGFNTNDTELDRIDRELLGGSLLDRQSFLRYRLPGLIRPTTMSRKMERLLLRLLEPENFRTKQCK